MALNINKIRSDFPFFAKNPSLVYFDNAATTQKPHCVIDAINDYYSSYNANVHRGVYTIAEKATYEFESSREYLAKFIGAENKENLIRNDCTVVSKLKQAGAIIMGKTVT